MPVRFDVRETPIVGLTIYITTCSPRIHRILVRLRIQDQRFNCLQSLSVKNVW